MKNSQAIALVVAAVLVTALAVGVALYLKNGTSLSFPTSQQQGYVLLSGSVNAYGNSVSSILFTSGTGQQISTSPSHGSYSVSLPNNNWFSIDVTYSATRTFTITSGSFTCTTSSSCFSSSYTTIGTYTCDPPRLLVNVTSNTMPDDITC